VYEWAAEVNDEYLKQHGSQCWYEPPKVI